MFPPHLSGALTLLTRRAFFPDRILFEPPARRGLR